MSQNQRTDCDEKLEKLNQEFEEFAYIVSHDLKAPVRAIYNLAGWVEEDLEPVLQFESRQNLTLLKNRVERLDKMIDALLAYSRITRTDLETGIVNLQELIQNLTLHYSCQFNLNVPEISINTYYKKLETVLEELIGNAVRFSEKANCEVSITAEDAGDKILFRIKDNGPGISAEAQTKIFTMFYTVSAKDKRNTTGAGLAMVKKIVAFAGGDINVQSEPGHGSTFILSWPKNIL